eukprot:Em0016g295a
MFLRDGHTAHKRTEIASMLDCRSIAYSDVLDVTVTQCYDIPGTTTKLVLLTDSANTHDSRGIEMYLHKKFYEKLEDLMSYPVRMTCNRLLPAEGTPNSSLLRLLPSEHVVIVLPLRDTCNLEDRFVPINSVDQSTVCEPGCYISNVIAEVAKIGTEEVVHCFDGTAFRRLVVQLKDIASVLTPLVLWDSYINFVRLFQEGDVLYLEKPYAKPSVNGSFCLEYGPGTVIYMKPFQPGHEMVCTQQSHKAVSVPVVKTLDGKLDFSTYLYQLHIQEVVPNLINVTLMSLCTCVSEREFFSTGGGGCSSERFKLELSDSSTSSISVVVEDPTHKIFKTLHANQCLVLEGLSTCAGDNGRTMMSCNIGTGGRIYNVSCLPGRLLTPYVCDHKTLAEACISDDVEFTTMVTLVSWDNASSPVQLHHSLCGHSSRKAGYMMTCDHCRTTEQLFVDGFRGTSVAVNADSSFCVDSGTDTRWVWMFSLVAVIEDKSGERLKMSFTSIAATSLLGCLPNDFADLCNDERVGMLESIIGKELLLCVSKVVGGFQVNLACRKP